MKSLGLCYCYVKMSWCGCVEHGLEYDAFYVKKYVASLKALFWSSVGLRRAARGALICENILLQWRYFDVYSTVWYTPIDMGFYLNVVYRLQ